MASGDDNDSDNADDDDEDESFPLLTWCHQETQPPVSPCTEESRQRRTHDQVKESKLKILVSD